MTRNTGSRKVGTNAFAGFRLDHVGGVPLLWCEDRRFKSFRVTLGCQRPMVDATGVEGSARGVAARSLLPSLLLQGTVAHPDRPSLASRMDELFGALVAPGIGRMGESQVLRFTLDAVAGEYLPGQPDQVGEGLAFLGEYLTSPRLVDGAFPGDVFARERDQAVAAAHAVADDKGAYAMQEARRHAFAGESLAIPDHGGIEALLSLQATEPEGVRQDALRHGRLWCVAMGPLPDDLPDRLDTLVAMLPPRDERPIPDPVQVAPRPSRSHTDRVELQQARQILLFRYPAPATEEGRAAAVLAAGLLGGGPHSRLFREVREKHSLVYSIGAHGDPHQGFLLVNAGLDEASVPKVLTEVQGQIDELAAGRFSVEELDTARAAILGPFAAVHDSIPWRIQYTLDQWLHDTDTTPEDKAALYGRVGAEQVAAAAKTLWLDFEYVLAPLDTQRQPGGKS